MVAITDNAVRLRLANSIRALGAKFFTAGHPAAYVSAEAVIGDGTVLAANRARKVNGKTLYFRHYPQGSLAANVIGYSTQTRSRAGIDVPSTLPDGARGKPHGGAIRIVIVGSGSTCGLSVMSVPTTRT